jgi:hypothetical protein
MSERITFSDDGWCKVTHLDPDTVEELRSMGHIEKLSLRELRVVTVKHARLLAGMLSVGQLWIRGATRPAIRHLVRLSGLRELDILSLEKPGRITGFDKAATLEIFRTNDDMTEREVRDICRCKTIKELGIQRARLTMNAIEALLTLPALERLDIECTRFSNKMARLLARSQTLIGLDLGATDITRIGLEHLVSMQRLTALDLWATALTEDDLELLRQLPALEYLSLGNYDHLPSLDPQRVMALLMALPNLKTVWLDGVAVGEEDKTMLEQKLERVRIM